jgi:sphinganine-1-phosphate aldolase
MYSTLSNWRGGIYATATQSGSKPGGIVVGAWAAMVVTGVHGYRAQARKVLTAARELDAGIRRILGLAIIGDPALSVIAFGTTKESGLNSLSLLDPLSAKGWDLNALQRPSCLHVCVTLPMANVIPQLLADIEDAMNFLRTKAAAAAVAGMKKVEPGEKAAMYGMAASLPLSIADEACHLYLDRTLAVSPGTPASHTSSAEET